MSGGVEKKREGMNPSSPKHHHDIMCWGDRCDGQFCTGDREAMVGVVAAVNCRCMRERMGWGEYRPWQVAGIGR